MKRKLLSLLLAMVMLLAIMPSITVYGANIIASGECGMYDDNLTWTLCDNGTLTISGTGDMWDWGYEGSPFYQYRSNIKIVIIEDNVTSIGDNAFLDCRNLDAVTIGNGVTSIGDNAFLYCENLYNINMSDCVKHISSQAFAYTAFYNDENNWENGVLYIGKHLVDSRKDIVGLYTIKPGTLTIADFAFSGRETLTGVNIPDSVTSIGIYAFHGTGYYDNSGNWENDILYIGNHLIEANRLVAGEITVKKGTITIADRAFSDCYNLTGITIPDSVKYIGKESFCRCRNLSYLDIGNGVIQIGVEAFENCVGLGSVEIPSSVKTIEERAFYDCRYVYEVYLPESLERIGDEAFVQQPYSEIYYSGNKNDWRKIKNCWWATGIDKEIHCKDGVILDFGSWHNTHYDNIYYMLCDDGILTVLGTGDMEDNQPMGFEYDVKSIIIENGITSIGGSAFGWLDDLVNVSLPNTLTKIGSNAFYRCKKLSSINIPGSVAVIGEGAFSRCESLSSVRIEEGVRQIEGNVFDGCNNLSSIVIPATIIEVDKYAFSECYNLADIYYGGTKEQWEILVGYNYDLRNVTIHYNYKILSDDEKYVEDILPFVPEVDNTHKGETDFDNSQNRSNSYHNNVVRRDNNINGDYIIRDSAVTVESGKNLTVSGKIIIENGSLTINGGRVTASGLEINSGGSVNIRSNGELTVNGNINVKGKSGQGGKLSIDGKTTAKDVNITEYGEIQLSDKLYVDNFLIKTSSRGCQFYSSGELWLKGNFTQRRNGALFWADGEYSVQPMEGFSVMLEVNNKGHEINFDNPGKSYLYNLYTVRGASDYSDNQWTGNPDIRGARYGISKTGLGYTIHKNDVIDSEYFAKQAIKEIQAAAKKENILVQMGYGVSEFGTMNSPTNEALKEYLYAYISGVAALYPDDINVSTKTWYEVIPVWYEGKYHDVTFYFKIANIYGQSTIGINYSYRNSEPKQCFTFLIGNKNELAQSIKKYAYSTYDKQMADYFMMPLNQYMKDKKSKLASLLWNGVKDLQINGWGLNIDGGKKYVKDYFKKGVDKYLDSIEKTIGTAKTAEVSIMSFDDESRETYAPAVMLSTEVAEPFSDEYFVNALKKALGVSALTPTILAGVYELDLSGSYITEISGIEQCVNLKALNLSGNAIADLRPLAGLTQLENLDISGSSVSDLRPLSGLKNLTNLTLKNNLISDLSGLEDLSALINLDLAFNYVSDVSALSGLSGLESLNLTGNNISDIKALANMPRLKTLYLGENMISDIMPLSNISLERLSVAENRIADISAINPKALVLLDISVNNISDIGVLAGANSLKNLYLAENTVSDISSLTNVSSLDVLNINGNFVYDISPLSDLNLTELECAYNGITDFSPIAGLASLKKLNLQGNYVEGFGFISNLNRLQRLGASGCDLYSIDMDNLPDSLIMLDVSSNSLVNIDNLATLENLEDLNISNNYIDNITPLFGMASLKYVDISNNGITDLGETSIDIVNRTPEVALDGLYFVEERIEIVMGEQTSQSVSTLPYNAYVGKLNWNSSNPEVAEVTDGVVVGKTIGCTTITASTANGDITASYEVIVAEGMIYNVQIDGNKVSAVIENISEINYGSVTAFIAAYSEDSLIGIERIDIENFSPGFTQNIAAGFVDIGSNVKIFLWKDMEPIESVYNI